MLNFDNISFYKLVTKTIEEKGVEDAVARVSFALFERIGTYWLVGAIFPGTGTLRYKYYQAKTDSRNR